MALMAPDRLYARHEPVEQMLVAMGAVTTAELLFQLAEAAQVIADHRGVDVTLVREILLEWEVHRPMHP